MISMDSSPDIIKDASDALKPIEDRGITVMQGWYDKDLNKCHVTLWDLGETDDNFSDDDAEGVTLSLQITIFSKEDEVELAKGNQVSHEREWVLIRGEKRRRFKTGRWNLYESTAIHKIL